MRTTVLKRITMVLFAVVVVEVAVIGSLFLTGHDADAKTKIADVIPVMTIIDTLAPTEEPAEEPAEESKQEAIVQESEAYQEAYDDSYIYAVYKDYAEYVEEDDLSYGEISDGASAKRPIGSHFGLDANKDGAWLSASDFMSRGVYYDSSGWSYTWYSEKVLPGGGLDIPGRHVNDEGYVVDENENLCVASDDLPYGTVVNVPFSTGTAVVYDCGGGYGNLDVYVAW